MMSTCFGIKTGYDRKSTASSIQGSLHVHMEGFLIRNTLAHTEGMSAMFCRKPKVSRVSKQRLWWTDGAEAHVTMQAEVRSQRGHAGHQSKVAASV
jgi:hypothetical protein